MDETSIKADTQRGQDRAGCRGVKEKKKRKKKRERKKVGEAECGTVESMRKRR
jgi:hypothetical protein